jgi:hypothetical protein
MKPQKIKHMRSVSTKATPKDSDRDTELKAINRILDRRYEVLIKLS